MGYEDSESDEVNEQEKESSNEFEQTEEFNPEIQIPDNIDININESPSEEGEVSEDTENLDESEQDFSEFDNFVPSSRFNSRATINPFLEQSIEPVENLERDLQGVRTNTQSGNQSEVQNAPQYSSSLDTNKNYEQPRDETIPQFIKPASVGLSTPIRPDEQIGWRNPENSGYPSDEIQNYKFASPSETKKRRDDL